MREQHQRTGFWHGRPDEGDVEHDIGTPRIVRAPGHYPEVGLRAIGVCNLGLCRDRTGLYGNQMTEALPATRDGITRAAELLRRGALVAFGTETVYGLGGDAT